MPAVASSLKLTWPGLEGQRRGNGQGNRWLWRRLARAPEAVAGRPVGRPPPWERRASQSCQARPEEAQEPSWGSARGGTPNGPAAARVHDVKEVVLLAGGLQQHRHGRGLDREAALLLVDARVGVPAVLLLCRRHRLDAGLRRLEVVRLVHQHVDEGRLAVVQVADDGDVADEVRVLHHGYEELLRVHVRRLLLLDDVEVLGLDRRDDSLRDRHRVLVLHSRLDLLAVHLHRGGIVLLVLVQHNATLLLAASSGVL
eukprot:scaffold86053_cov47-Phaeocystis_antarctica.AAC.4